MILAWFSMGIIKVLVVLALYLFEMGLIPNFASIKTMAKSAPLVVLVVI